MKRIRYTKYVPDPAGEMSMEDLLGALSDYLLQSGFQNYLSYYDLPDGEQTLDDLRDAIEQALLDSDLLSEELREQLQQMQGQGSLDELIEKLIEKNPRPSSFAATSSRRCSPAFSEFCCPAARMCRLM